jgi:hypothetical protein
MAKPTLELITALRATADRLDGGVRYQWTHMGSCNCGHLAQTLTQFNKATIHKLALETPGDWSEHARAYCASSGYPIDEIITKMIDAGLNVHDIAELERLNNDGIAREVVERHDFALPLDFRAREHVVAYLRVWADQLERRWRAEQARKEERDAARARRKSREPALEEN